MSFQSLAIGNKTITLVAREGAGWQNKDVTFIFLVLAVFVTSRVAGVGPVQGLALSHPFVGVPACVCHWDHVPVSLFCRSKRTEMNSTNLKCPF